MEPNQALLGEGATGLSQGRHLETNTCCHTHIHTYWKTDDQSWFIMILSIFVEWFHQDYDYFGRLWWEMKIESLLDEKISSVQSGSNIYSYGIIFRKR